MPPDLTTIEQAGEKIRQAQHIGIISHTRPDGDAVGSTIGLGLALQQAGKQVQMVLSDGVPSNLRHLEGAQLVRRQFSRPLDLMIVVDCSNLARAGNGVTLFDEYGTPDLNIDHHATNQGFAQINLVDPNAVSVTEMLATYLPAWGFALTPPAAAALVTGLITDTIGFRTPNVTASTMRCVADLMDLGADMPKLYRLALIDRTFESLQLWGRGLTRLQHNDGLVWTSLTLEDRKIAGYPGKDDADLINLLATVKDQAVALIFVEQPEGNVKVSWRARPGIDVSTIAMSFGGGGHPAASGAILPGPLEEVLANVINATQTLLNSPATD